MWSLSDEYRAWPWNFKYCYFHKYFMMGWRHWTFITVIWTTLVLLCAAGPVFQGRRVCSTSSHFTKNEHFFSSFIRFSDTVWRWPVATAQTCECLSCHCRHSPHSWRRWAHKKLYSRPINYETVQWMKVCAIRSPTSHNVSWGLSSWSKTIFSDTEPFRLRRLRIWATENTVQRRRRLLFSIVQLFMTANPLRVALIPRGSRHIAARHL